MTEEGKHGQCLLDRTPGVKADSNFACTACTFNDFPFAAEIFVNLMLGQRPIQGCFHFNTILYVFRNPSLRSTYMISFIIY